MKYIKTFEELNIDTYLSASKELRELGFEDRANNLREKVIDEFFKELFDGMYTMEYEERPESIFFVKKINDEIKIYMEQDSRNEWLWCNYGLLWSFFKNDIGLEYRVVQKLIKERVEEAFKIKVSTPHIYQLTTKNRWLRLLHKI